MNRIATSSPQVWVACLLALLVSACASPAGKLEVRKSPLKPSQAKLQPLPIALPVKAEAQSLPIPTPEELRLPDLPFNISQEPPSPEPSEVEERAEPPAEQEERRAPPAPPKSPPKLVSFNFEEADLLVVIRALADVAGINFILGQGVKVKVTMKVDGLPETEAFDIMQAILEANNLVAVKVGTIYKILPAAAAQQQPAPIGLGRDLVAETGYFTQIVPLQHLSAEGMIDVFEPLFSQGKVLAHPETNSLILSGPAPVIRQVVDTVEALDVPGRKKDVPQIYVYHLENAKASELASVIESVFAVKVEQAKSAQAMQVALLGLESPSSVPTPPRPGARALRSEEAPAPTATGAAEPAKIVGEIRIVPDERTNALIIKATPGDFMVIENTIKKLDITPKQVVIEILVAEVALTDSFNLGVEWFVQTGMLTFAQAFGLGPAAGLTMTFIDQDQFRLFLNTISSVTEVNIVTSPHLLTVDNMSARIQVGQEVPIVTGTQSTTTAIGAGGENVFQTIAQRDIGRILDITPHVSEERQVTLEINLEISDTLPETTVAGTPSFSQRSINTTVVVDDGQSLLIGGIIDKSTQHERTGIPLLKDIPYLGVLFGTTTETEIRSELLIMLTPHVIATPEEGGALTEQFKERLDWLEEQLRTFSPHAARSEARVLEGEL